MVWTQLFIERKAATPLHHLLALPASQKPFAASYKDQDFPDYLVDVTRNSLLSFTTSLTKVSTQAHNFFARINSMLAYERMIRSCFGWMAPVVPAAAALAPAQMAMPQMSLWTMPDWFGFAIPQPPVPQRNALPWLPLPQEALPRTAAIPATPAAVDAGLPVYDAMLAFSAAILTVTPVAMKMWGLG